MIDKKQLKDLVTKTLIAINLHSEDAVNLVLGTIAQESAGGKYLRQLGSGPAVGICQMEPFTFNNHIKNYLAHKPDLKEKIKWFTGIDQFKVTYLEWNLALSIAMCRVHYLRRPEPLPSTIEGYAKYWKKWYNTYLGAGTETEFINNYKKYLL
jgi:hypothetical protein